MEATVNAGAKERETRGGGEGVAQSPLCLSVSRQDSSCKQRNPLTKQGVLQTVTQENCNDAGDRETEAGKAWVREEENTRQRILCSSK